MTTAKHELSNVEIVYTDDAGNLHTQPLSDVMDVGTLIDPETGEDMEMSWVEVSTPADAKSEALRGAIEDIDSAGLDAYAANAVVSWLSARADRIEKGESNA